MRVMMISGDKNLLTPGTEAAQRLEHQRAKTTRLDVMVWPQVHSWRDVVKMAREGMHTVVSAQDPFWRGLLAWWVTRRGHQRLQLQVHADLSAQPWHRRLLAGWLLRRADTVRAVSEPVARQVRATGTQARVHVLPVYVDLERFRAVTRVPHDREIILWVGRFEKEKDPLLAIDVLRQVREKGRDVALIMLGAGRLEKALHKAARGLPVEFPGWKPPEDYLAIADVVLSTSRHESWGASIIEGLAAGVPVIAPDVGVAREAGAIVVDRRDLAKTIGRVLEEKPRGELHINFLNKEEWGKRWHETLA